MVGPQDEVFVCPSPGSLASGGLATLSHKGRGERPSVISDAFDPKAPIDWAAVKHDFTHSGMSLARIGDAHGTTAGTIRHYAKLGGWVREVPTVPLRRGRSPKPPGTPKPTPAQRRNRKLVERLIATLETGIAQLEARMALDQGAAQVSAADVERTARAMSNLTQLLQKLFALDEEARGLGQEASKPMEATDDADALRRALALRLERLNQPRNSA